MEERNIPLTFIQTCQCDICGVEAQTTLSQYPQGSHLDAAKLKTRDAIQCVKCKLVLCMGCAVPRLKINEKEHVISPFTCAVCGEPFSPV